MCLFYEFFIRKYLIGMVDDFELLCVIWKVNASQFMQVVVFFNQELNIGIVFYEIGVQSVKLVPVDSIFGVKGD